jgi:hypothetical protein
MRAFDKIVGIRIGIPPAIARSYFINRAVIVRSQERARAVLHDIISILVQPQVGFNEHGFFQSQMPGNPLNVGSLEPGTDCFATAGAGQTIYMGKRLLMQGGQMLFRASAFFILELSEKLPVFLFLSLGFFLPVLEEIFHQAKLSKIGSFFTWISQTVASFPLKHQILSNWLNFAAKLL